MEAILFQFGLSSVVFSLERLGFFQLLFPFLLSLAIVYGILKWTLKEQIGNSGIGLISIVISFFVMLYSATNPFIVTFLTSLSGATVVGAVAILALAIFLGLFGIKITDLQKGRDGKSTWMWYVIILIVLYVVVSLFFGASGLFIPNFLIGTDFWAVVFFIVILAIAWKFLSDEDEGGGDERKASK